MIHLAPQPAATLAVDERRRRHGVAPYAEALTSHAAHERLSLFVPGHGRGEAGLARGQAEFFGRRVLELDVPPLVPGIDLGEGSPKALALALAAEAWGARRSWFLTNGSSQGNRTAAIAVAGLGRAVLMQRSAHSSFVDGVILAGLRPQFVIPSIDTDYGIAHGVTAQSVASQLAAMDAPPAAVYIVSPSYFGAVADVRAIADVVHAAGSALIVDAAWGAHFGFMPELPESALRLGADIAIMSTHKLTGSLTQGAVLHLGETALADSLEPLIERAIAMSASTSESSLLGSSIDIARRDMVVNPRQLEDSLACVHAFREYFRAVGRFPIVSDTFDRFDDIVDVDPFRIPIDITATGMDGHSVRTSLARDHGISLEVATTRAVVAVVGAGMTPRWQVLHAALDELAGGTAGPTATVPPVVSTLPESGPLVLTPREAFFGRVEAVPTSEAAGRVSASTLSAYPPGIPNVVPGERLTRQVVDFLQAVDASPNGYVRGGIRGRVDAFNVVAST